VSEGVKEISVGLLAYGAIGDEHSKAIRAVEGLRLTAVADTNPDRLAAARYTMLAFIHSMRLQHLLVTRQQ
jgi:predicted dehydrogenase